MDLSSELHPQPKTFKLNKEKKPIRKIGKKGRASLSAVAQMKVDFKKMGIVSCEVRFDPCWDTQALSFAHPDKRRFLKPEDLTTAILACVPCHTIIEQWPREKMRAFVMEIIAKRKTP